MEALKEARTKVNGKFLAEYSGKPVTILGNILKVNPNGSSFEMKSTDNAVINVILSQPLTEPIEGWVEVRGLGQGKCHVIAQHYLSLPNSLMADFDADLFDDLICVINTCNNPWVTS